MSDADKPASRRARPERAASAIAASRRVHILGTRGIPNAHGGFEAFAERLAPFLASRGRRVTVYCQRAGGEAGGEREWRGVRLVDVPVSDEGARGSIAFDWLSATQAIREGGTLLTLGFNTAVFFLRHRLAGVRHIVNMDGIEWRRAKWTPPIQAWFYANSWCASTLATHMVADHPEIARMLEQRPLRGPVTMIPYGADVVHDVDPSPLAALGVEADRFGLVIARPEPENSIREIVEAWSRNVPELPLVVLGHYDQAHPYHRAVRAAAGVMVRFPGALYDAPVVQALRAHARVYVHGHTVGGTNPSLVEALGAASATVAHDNVFNRWVAGDGAVYFSEVEGCGHALRTVVDDAGLRAALRDGARRRHAETFTWDAVLSAYERLLS